MMIYRAKVKGKMKNLLIASTSSQLAQFSTVTKRGLTQLHKL